MITFKMPLGIVTIGQLNRILQQERDIRHISEKNIYDHEIIGECLYPKDKYFSTIQRQSITDRTLERIKINGTWLDRKDVIIYNEDIYDKRRKEILKRNGVKNV